MPTNVEPSVPAAPGSIAALLVAAVDGAANPETLVLRSGHGGDASLGDVARQLDALGVVRWGAEGLLTWEGVDARDLAIRWAAWEAAASASPDLDRLRDIVAAAPATERVAPSTWSGDVEGVGGDAVAAARWRGRWQALAAGLVDRDDVAALTLRTVLARDNLLLIGPPGTGKSLLARRAGAMLSGVVFEALLSRFTQPDELFGPLDVAALREGVYQRRTDGYLPGADVAFLDELFKGGAAVLNTLLGVLNERVFHEGNQRRALPLQAVIGASNELPARDDALYALLDRFLVRLEVGLVDHAAGLLRIVEGGAQLDGPPDAHVPTDEIAAVRAAAEAVTVPPLVQQALVELWRHARAAGIEVSDRRWKAAVRWLRVGAAAEARPRLDLDDLGALDAVLTLRARDRNALAGWLADAVSEASAALRSARADAILVSLDRVCPAPGEPLLPAAADPWQRRAISVRRARARVLASRAALSRPPRAFEVGAGAADAARLRALARLEAHETALASYAATLEASGDGPPPPFQAPA